MSARVPYIGDMPQLPQLPALPVLPTRLGSRQRIEFSNSENVDENIPPPDEDEGELIIETPPRSPKGKERDVIVRNSASASLPISVKNEPPPKPVEVFAVRNPIVNKAIKAEKTLFADKYNKNGGDNDYHALVDRVAREHAELHTRCARGDSVGEHEWMENARGFAQILEMMTVNGKWTHETVDGAANAGKRYVVPTNDSNLATYVPPILHKVVTGICAAVGGAVAANISLGATGVLLVVTVIGIYMIPTWNAGAQSGAVAGQLQDGAPITPEVSSKQVFRFVEKEGDPGKYERKAVPVRPPVAVKKELAALNAVANEIDKTDGPAQAIALLTERIKAREERILALYASKTKWEAMLSPATKIWRSNLKRQIKERQERIEYLSSEIEEIQPYIDEHEAPTDRIVLYEIPDGLELMQNHQQDFRQQKQDLELKVGLDQRELELIERTARHQCMTPNEIEEIANREDDIIMLRDLRDKLPSTSELGNNDAARAFLEARITACRVDLEVAKVMEQINYTPYQSRGRGERAVFNGFVSAVGIGKAGDDVVKALGTQQAASLPIAATTDQADLTPQPSQQSQTDLSPDPSPQPQSDFSPDQSPQPQSHLSPEPSSQPQPDLSPGPSSQPQPDLSPEPSPQPDLQPQPEPSPEPARVVDEFQPDWATFGVNMGTAAIQTAQVVRYARNQKVQAGKDQLLKWAAQCLVLAKTAGGGLWTKENDPDSNINLKLLDDLKRGWLKARCGHMSEIVGFDADVVLMYLFKDLASGDPGPVKVSVTNNKNLDYKDVFLTADDLMDAFKNCVDAKQRKELLIQLLTGKAILEKQIKTPDATIEMDDVELSDEQANLLKEYADLIQLSTELKNGNVDAFFASELIEEEAKQNFENALLHAILNNTHEGLAGFLTMVTPEERKQYSEANDWLAEVKGRVEKESMANYYQLVQKRVQQHTHAIFGSASSQIARSLGTLVSVVLTELGYDLAAASTLVLLDSLAFFIAVVNLGMSYAYYRFIIAKNVERELAERLGVRSLPHTGSLKKGGYFSLPNLAYYTGEVTDFSRLVAKPLQNTAGVKVRYEQQLSPTAMIFKQLWSAAPLNKWRTEEGKFMFGLMHYYRGYFYKEGVDLEDKENPFPLTDEQVQGQLRIDLTKVVPADSDNDLMSLHSPISVRHLVEV
jgi:hypothetical protein